MLDPYRSGMLAIHSTLLTYILRSELSPNPNHNHTLSLSLSHSITPIKQEPYSSDNIFLYLSNSIDFLTLLPLLIVFLKQTGIMLQ